MVWRKTCAMEERMRFVMAVEHEGEAFAAICRSFGVSRRIGYKWLERYREEGIEGLAGPLAGAAASSASAAGADRRTVHCGAPGASDLGAAEGTQLA